MGHFGWQASPGPFLDDMNQANRPAKALDPVEMKITLGLLNAVEEDGAVTQRHLAVELGIALGLVNAYLKRCVNKGLIKVQEIPSRRYAYYLTPKGFAEKSRLTASYLLYSFDFFRQARRSCEHVLDRAARLSWRNVVLMGASDLAEIAIVCSLDRPVRIVALVDSLASSKILAGVPVVADISEVEAAWDGVIISDIAATQDAYIKAATAAGEARVLIPDVLKQAVTKVSKPDVASS